MMDKLLELLSQCFFFFIPWEIIRQFEQSVQLRFGRFYRVIGPGFHWCLPFMIDEFFTDNVVPRTKVLTAQSLITADGKPIVIETVVTARIEDIKKAVLEVEGVDDALVDSCMGAIGQLVSKTSWEEVQGEKFLQTALTACRRNARKYGLEVLNIQLCDLAPCRVYRLHGDAR